MTIRLSITLLMLVLITGALYSCPKKDNPVEDAYRRGPTKG